MQDPEVYLGAIGVDLACPVYRDRDAVLDADHRIRVGHEFYFFSGPEAMAEFRRRPLRYIDRLTDPVSETRFTPTEHSPTYTYEDREFYFAGLDTLEAFQADPATYVEPRRVM